MIYVCLWSPRWAIGGAPLDELAASLLDVAPRVAVDGRGVIWADARGLPAREVARALVAGAGGEAGEVRAGISAVPVAAELAARSGDGAITLVESGREREFLAPLSLDLLEVDPRLRVLLDGVGVRTCGAVADLSREAMEVRFGPAAGALWRLARAEDRRILFRPIPRERPQASMDFVEYEVREAGRLVFTANALLGSVCATLASRGERARSISLSLSLSGGGVRRERLRAARPTANRDFWIRRVQEMLDRLRLPEPVVGVSLEVDETESRSSTQGDLFDRGFATAGAVEEAVGRLLDGQGEVFVAPERDGHPLAERRTRWVARSAVSATGRGRRSPELPAPALTLQLLREPRALAVKIALRGMHLLPESFLDSGEWHGVAVAAGPDRVSGGRWEDASYARDYFRCVTGDGRLVWIFRDLDENRWYLHGWWE
jgi:protein ImuB